MAEIRFTIPKKLNERVEQVAKELGVGKSAYVRSLILTDLRAKDYKSK